MLMNDSLTVHKNTNLNHIFRTSTNFRKLYFRVTFLATFPFIRSHNASENNHVKGSVYKKIILSEAKPPFLFSELLPETNVHASCFVNALFLSMSSVKWDKNAPQRCFLAISFSFSLNAC